MTTEYLKQTVGAPLERALSRTVALQPRDPVYVLGSLLLAAAAAQAPASAGGGAVVARGVSFSGDVLPSVPSSSEFPSGSPSLARAGRSLAARRLRSRAPGSGGAPSSPLFRSADAGARAHRVFGSTASSGGNADADAAAVGVHDNDDMRMYEARQRALDQSLASEAESFHHDPLNDLRRALLEAGAALAPAGGPINEYLSGQKAAKRETKDARRAGAGAGADAPGEAAAGEDGGAAATPAMSAVTATRVAKLLGQWACLLLGVPPVKTAAELLQKIHANEGSLTQLVPKYDTSSSRITQTLLAAQQEANALIGEQQLPAELALLHRWCEAAMALRMAISKRIQDTRLAQYKAAFSVFDIDESGTIDIGELREVLRSLGLEPSEDDLQEMIDSVDRDGSGELEFSEFTKLPILTLMAHSGRQV